MVKPLDQQKTSRLILFFLGFIVLTRLISLGTYPVMDKTESRYAEIAREMITTNNWVTLQLEPGVPFWGKPPLSTWAAAGSAKIFGVNAFAVRLPSLIFAILTCFLVYLLGKSLRDHFFGLVCALVLPTVGLFYTMSGSVMTDPPLLMCVTLSMVSFIFVMNNKPDAGRRLWSYLFFAGLGLCILAKGPLGWVMIFFPIICWSIYFKRVKEVIQNFPWFTGMLLALVIAVPWHILAEARTPGFNEYYFIGEHFKRFVVKDWKGDLYGSAHVQPKGMIWLFGIPATMPWIIVFIPMLIHFFKKGKRIKDLLSDPWLSLICLWFLAPFIFFSFASNIGVHYCLVGMPAFAVLLASGICTGDHIIKEGQKGPWFTNVNVLKGFFCFVPVVGFVASITLLPFLVRQNSQMDIVKLFQKSNPRPSAQLVYVQQMPSSADFYSNGRAIDISDQAYEKMMVMLNDDVEDYYVVKTDHIQSLSAKFFEMTQEIGHYGEFIIRKER